MGFLLMFFFGLSYWVGGATWEAIKEKRKQRKSNQFSLIDIKKGPVLSPFMEIPS
jgi:hypothetical protein